MNKFISGLAGLPRRLKGIPKVPLGILLLFVFSGIFAPFLALHNPEIGNPEHRLTPPIWQNGGRATYPLGTDTLGRDIYSRLVFGARISLVIAFIAVIISSTLGACIGAISGFFGGKVDLVIMRIVDTWISIPPIMFGILMAIIAGPGMWNIAIIISIIMWTRYARVVRGETLSLKSRDFVHLATVAGVSKFRIIARHILPNVMPVVITMATVQIGVAIGAEAALSFLGVGVPPPKPAWGLMLAECKGGLFTGHWWPVVLPGFCIMMFVMSINFIGDYLRRRIDPHFRHLWEK